MSGGAQARGAPAARERGSWEALGRLAASRETSDSAPLCELVAFELAGDGYALPVERVREVVRPGRITPMPRVPATVLGVLPLRGEMVEVIDLRRRLSLPPGERTRRSRVVVLHAGDGGTAGLLVDAAAQVLRVPQDAVRPAAPDSVSVEALVAHEGRFLSLIDVEQVLDLGVRG